MIFSIYGTDHYRCQQKLNELVAEFRRQKDQGGLNVVRLEAETLDEASFRQEVLATPFLSEKKLIVIKNILRQKKKWEPIFTFLKARSDELDNNLVFIDFLINEKKARPVGPFFDYLKKQKYAWEFNLLGDWQIKNHLAKDLAARQIAIEPAATIELIALVGNDLGQLELEISKLVAYKNGAPITKADVIELVRAKYDENIFNLIDAIGGKNKKTALRLTAEQLSAGNHPLVIVSNINRQFKTVFRVQAGGDLGGLHPYVAQKARGQARNFSLEQTKNILSELLTMESELKSGAKNPELLLDLFINKNC